MNEQLQQISDKLDNLLKQIVELKDQNNTASDQKLLSLTEAARYLGLSPSRVYALIYEGKLQPAQRSKFSRIQFSKTTLNQYLYAKRNN